MRLDSEAWFLSPYFPQKLYSYCYPHELFDPMGRPPTTQMGTQVRRNRSRVHGINVNISLLTTE